MFLYIRISQTRCVKLVYFIALQQSQVKVPDGYLSKGAFENMWYHRQPSMCQMSKDLVLVFRPDDVLIKNPNMEKYQGFYTIGASSTWNAMCMTAVADDE